MEMQYILAPEELFYLAKLCGGKHLDYDYISMMHDIEQRRAIHKDKCSVGLEKKGILNDNWGEITVNPDAVEILEPIWNGNFEAKISDVTIGDTITARTLYLHRNDKRTIMVCLQEDGLHIFAVNDSDLSDLIYNTLPDGIEENDSVKDFSPSADDVKELILAKNVFNDKRIGMVEQLWIYGGSLWKKDSENLLQPLKASEAFELLKTVLKGE